jgi:molybdopterin-containing oxidoreductase family iron-sulfur binding subunit
MDIKRRQFLKIAGLSTIAGLGAPAAFNMLLKGKVSPVSFASSGAGTEASHGASQAGVRLGMIIDQRVFDANKDLAQKCITACHTVHNVPDFGNPKDEIKWIFKVPYEKAFTTKSHNYRNEHLHESSFLVLCNHCDNPPCVRACPTKATFKRKKDGIIAMDYHRCIGCRFCMAACPYGMRSFNWRDPRPFIDKTTYNKEFPTRMRGVVEKCNFCVERLAKGLQPACVEACGDTGALVFGDLNDSHSEIRKILKENFTIQRKPALGTMPSVFYIV